MSGGEKKMRIVCYAAWFRTARLKGVNGESSKVDYSSYGLVPIKILM